MAGEAGGESGQDDFLTFRDLFAVGLEPDEAVAEVDDGLSVAGGNVADTEVGTAEFARAAGVDPKHVFRFAGDEDDGVIEPVGRVGEEDFLSPGGTVVEFQLLGVDESDGAVIEKVGGDADGIAEIIQVGWIGDLALDDDAFRGSLDAFEKLGIIRLHDAGEAGLGKGEDGMLFAIGELDGDARRDAGGAINFGHDINGLREMAIEGVEDHGVAAAGLMAGPFPIR